VIEAYLAGLQLSDVPELDAAMHYALAGGKRIRARLCMAAARAGGADPQLALPAAGAIELVQAFSLVHDDLPALDDDSIRRGRPTSHVAYGEAVAILSGDGLLNAAFRLVAGCDLPAPTRLAVVGELSDGIAGMIDGQYLDVAAAAPGDMAGLRDLHRLKTGALISASVACGLHVAGLTGEALAPYRAFAAELGLLFQIVDDLLDEGDDGAASYVSAVGAERARALAGESRTRALELLAAAPGDTVELAGLTELIAGRSG